MDDRRRSAFDGFLQDPQPACPKLSVVEVSSVDAKAWSRLASGHSFYLSHPWLHALERDTDFATRYLLACDEAGRIVGALPAHAFVGQKLYLPYDHFGLFVEPAAAAQKRDEWFPVLLGGTRAGYVNEVLCEPDLPSAGKAQVTARLLSAFVELGDRLGVRSLSLMHLTPAALLDVLPFLGPRATAAVLPVAYYRLQTPWSSFAGYLQSLPHDRRRTVRRDLAHFDKSGLTISTGRLSEWYERAGPLVANLQQRHGHPQSAEEMTDYLAKQVADLDGASVVFLCHAGSDLVGFSLMYQWEGVLYARAVGFDYDLRGDSAAYFNLAFYQPIRFAIEHGLSAVDLGAGSDMPKVLRGATPQPMWSVIGAAGHVPSGWQHAVRHGNEDACRTWVGKYGRWAGAQGDKWRLDGPRAASDPNARVSAAVP